MEQTDIFSATLGLCHPWHVTAIEVLAEGTKMNIMVDYVYDGSWCCPACGQTIRLGKTKQETWRHRDFFRHDTYLYARIPHFECVACGIHAVDRPWSRAGSKFSLFTD